MPRKAIPKKVREEVHKKYGECCAYCGIDLEYKDMQVDHIIAQKMFPIVSRRQDLDYHVDHMCNLNPSCRVCNNFKHCLSIEGLRRELGKQIKRAKKYSVNFRMAEKYGQLEINETPIIFHFESYEEKLDE